MVATMRERGIDDSTARWAHDEALRKNGYRWAKKTETIATNLAVKEMRRKQLEAENNQNPA